MHLWRCLQPCRRHAHWTNNILTAHIEIPYDVYTKTNKKFALLFCVLAAVDRCNLNITVQVELR